MTFPEFEAFVPFTLPQNGDGSPRNASYGRGS